MRYSKMLAVAGTVVLALSIYGQAVRADMRFTVTTDAQANTTGFGGVLAAISDVVGGPGAFHITTGDLIFFEGDISLSREVIDQYFGEDSLWYVAPGNHDVADMEWLREEYHSGHGTREPLKNFTNQDGPNGAQETTYTWDYGNTHFVILNEYWDGSSDTGADGDIVPELYNWLAADLATNRQPVTFVIGHEPAFPYERHVGDSLDAYPEHRDAFWQLLEDHHVTAYICGHTHYYSTHKGDKNHVGDVWQINPAAAGFGPDPEMFLDVTVSNTSVAISAYENSSEWRLVETVEIPLPLIGDFNESGVLDVGDIDGLNACLRSACQDTRFDLNIDGSVTTEDYRIWVRDLKHTWFGDADLDSEFNSSDMVQVFAAGTYETGESAGWSEGDWNGDGLFNSSDMVTAFADGGYEKGPRTAVAAVPEPGACVLFILGLASLLSAYCRA